MLETVSGATSSSINWILRAERALEKALVEPTSSNTYLMKLSMELPMKLKLVCF